MHTGETPHAETLGVVGLLLAAGAGTRMGRPKALVRSPDGQPWLTRTIDTLYAGGCSRVVVVLGAAADEARALLEADRPGVDSVVAATWHEGMSASLRAGLGAIGDAPETIALIQLVDLPGVGADVVRRLVAGVPPAHAGAHLARATYAGRPGHPVVIGRDHWHGLVAGLEGDSGGKMYLDAHHVMSVDCSDLSDGADVDMIAAG